MAKIFISYAHEDEARAKVVHRVLERAGWDVFIDSKLLAGSAFREELKQEVVSSSAVVVLWSRSSVASKFVCGEAQAAIDAAIPVVPLIIDDLPDNGPPLGFTELKHVRCSWERTGELADVPAQQLEAAVARVKTRAPLNQAIIQLRDELTRQIGSRYDILATVGTGRMSVVFKAREKDTTRVHAIKVTPLAGILLLPDFLAQFWRGIQASIRLQNPHIINIRHFDLVGSIAYTIADYVDGPALSEFLQRGPLRFEQVRHIGRGIADGLAYAHAEGVIHRNLRSSTILIGEDDNPVITEFGSASLDDAPALADGASTLSVLFSDARYMSPEQCRGETLTPRTDGYSLGVILYEMLTGKPPFEGGAAFQIMRRHDEEQPPPVSARRPDCPADVNETVMRLLHKDPNRRFLDAQEVVEEIGKWLTRGPASASVPPPSKVHEHAVREALNSYRRCVEDNPAFMRAFYKRLLEQPGMSELLRGIKNFAKQYEELARAIRRLLEFAAGDGEAEIHIERLGRLHQRLPLELDATHFRLFTDLLVSAVVDTDEAVNSDAGKEAALSAAWHEALRPGVERMLIAYRNVSVRSGVPPVPGEESATDADAAVR